MGRKSDTFRLSATEASRSFSHVLDEVEAGRRFLVQRRGRDVCLIGPPTVRGRSASDCLALLRARPPVYLDEAFAADLLQVIEGEPAEERPSWGS